MKPEKRSLALLLSLFLFLGVVTWYVVYNDSLRESEKMQKNNIFQSENPAFDFSFEYPATGWSLDESQGRTEKYDAVYLKGPVDEEKQFRFLIEVVVKPLQKGGAPADLLQAFLGRVSPWPKFKLVSKKEATIGGEKAFSAIYESEERLPIESLNGKPTMIKEQTIFLTRKDRSYRFSFHALADQWDASSPAFKQVLKTFKFKE